MGAQSRYGDVRGKCIVLPSFSCFLQLVSASYQLQGLHTWRFKTEPDRSPKGGKSIAPVWAKQQGERELKVWDEVEPCWDWNQPSWVGYAAEWRLLGCFLPSVALPVFQNYEEILTVCHKNISLFLHQVCVLDYLNSAALRSCTAVFSPSYTSDMPCHMHGLGRATGSSKHLK